MINITKDEIRNTKKILDYSISEDVEIDYIDFEDGSLTLSKNNVDFILELKDFFHPFVIVKSNPLVYAIEFILENANTSQIKPMLLRSINNEVSFEDIPETNKYNIMRLAQEAGDNCVLILFDKGWRLNIDDEEAKNLMLFFALSGHEYFFKKLINCQPDFNIKEKIHMKENLIEIVRFELNDNKLLEKKHKEKLEILLSFFIEQEKVQTYKELTNDLPVKSKSSILKI